MSMLPQDLARHAGKYYGKYSGEVTSVTDERHQGRICVRVPSVFGTELAVEARPCFGYGQFYVPDVGDQVWVEFEGGDPGFPLWVGVWYPVDAVPEEARIDPPQNRVLQTAAGHTIEIQDTEGEEKITIRHKENSFISIDANGSVLISNQKGSHIMLNSEAEETTIVEQHGNYLRMTADGISLVDNDGAATLQLTGGTARLIAESILLEGTVVAVGQGAADPPPEPAILGQTFANMWNTFVSSYAAHTHATAMGPSGPPLPPLVPPPLLAPGKGLAAATVVK